MTLRRFLTPLLFGIAIATAQADQADIIRKSLPNRKGMDLINAYDTLYSLSLETDDINYQLRCINDLLAETHRQGERQKEGGVRVEKMSFFHNNNFNDSIYEQVPHTLKYLEQLKDWRNYYETWSILIDTYNFDGKKRR